MSHDPFWGALGSPNLSCPAVSHSWRAMLEGPRVTLFIWKSNPEISTAQNEIMSIYNSEHAMLLSLRSLPTVALIVLENCPVQ